MGTSGNLSVDSGKPRLLSSCERGHEIALKSLQGNPASLCIEG